MPDVFRTHQYENPRNQAPYASVMISYVIKRRGALFHWRYRQFRHARPPLSYMYMQHLLPARHSRTKQLEVKEEKIDKTMSSA